MASTITLADVNPNYPSLVPPYPLFPFLLPPAPRPHPMPPAPISRGGRRTKLLSRRNLVQEANDLSDEEAEVDDTLLAVRNRGASFLIPLGKRHTLVEERADASSSDGTSSGEGSQAGEGEAEDEEGGEDDEGDDDEEGDDDDDDEEEDEEHDLDEDMENLDDEEGDDDGDGEGDDDDEDEDGELGDEDGEEDGAGGLIDALVMLAGILNILA
ncbi:hypothetical protein FRB98_006860 [Tulasnella sp. 332]|nr:hypothetical protein FRB98_006860 [Tulasnella sp. 332]